MVCFVKQRLSRGGSNLKHSVNVIYCKEVLLTYDQGEDSAVVRVCLLGMWWNVKIPFAAAPHQSAV